VTPTKIVHELSKNWVDLVIVLAIAGAIFRGYRAGFSATIFSAIGFIGGGLAGLTLGLKYLHFVGITKFAVLFLAIVVGSSIGEVIIKPVAKLFHEKILFGPFKWVDSLLGVIFSVVRTLFMVIVIAHLLLITPWSWAQTDIPQSTIYTKLSAYAPEIISQITKKAESIR